MKDNESNSIRLGDAFFSSFLPVFDVENESIGLALAARAPEGSVKVEVASEPEILTE